MSNVFAHTLLPKSQFRSLAHNLSFGLDRVFGTKHLKASLEAASRARYRAHEDDRKNHFNPPKLVIPKFHGTNDPEDYIAWESKVSTAPPERCASRVG